MRNSFIFLFSFFGIALAIGFEGEKIKWREPSYPGLSFMYPACVDYTASPGMGDNYAYEFSNNGKCPKSDLGNWSIYIGSYGHPDYAKGVLIPGRQWIDTKMNIKGISMTVKEDKDLKSFEPWNVRFKCNDTDVRVTYHADMSLPRPDWHHKMPAPLKEFLETVHCEKN